MEPAEIDAAPAGWGCRGRAADGTNRNRRKLPAIGGLEQEKAAARADPRREGVSRTYANRKKTLRRAEKAKTQQEGRG